MCRRCDCDCRAQDFAGGEPDVVWSSAWARRASHSGSGSTSLVDQRDKPGARGLRPVVNRDGETAIRAQAYDARALLAGGLGGAILRAVIDGDDLRDRIGLRPQLFKQGQEQFAAIPNRDDDGDRGSFMRIASSPGTRDCGSRLATGSA